MMMIILSLTTLSGCGKEKASTSASGVNATQKIASGENLTIPVKEISEKALFYSVEVDGTQMEVIAVKDSDGNIRTATPAKSAMIPVMDIINRKMMNLYARTVVILLQ